MSEVAPLAVGIPFATAALLAALKPWRTGDDLIATSVAGVTAIFCVALLIDAIGSEWPRWSRRSAPGDPCRTAP